MKSDADKWTWEPGKRGLNLSWDVLHHVKGEKNILHLWGEEINMALSCYCEPVCVRSILKSCQARDLVCVKLFYFVSLHKISVIIALTSFLCLKSGFNEDVRKSDMRHKILFLVYIIFIILILLSGKPINVEELSHNAFRCSQSLLFWLKPTHPLKSVYNIGGVYGQLFPKLQHYLLVNLLIVH